MLTLLREMLRSKIALGVIALLILSLAAFGVTDIFTAPRSDALVRAGAVTLTQRDFDTRVETFINNEGRRSGKFRTKQDLAKDGTLDALFAQIVSQSLQRGYAAKLGAEATDAGVLAAAMREPAFFSQATGAFDPQTYRSVLANARIEERAYERDQREALTVSGLRTALEGALVVPDVLARPSLSFLTETRELSWLQVPEVFIPEPDPATIADAQAFYDANPDRFAVGERRVISVLSFSEADFNGIVEVSEEDILAEYEAGKASRYVMPRAVRFTELSYADAATARDAFARLSVGESLGALPAALQPMQQTPRAGVEKALGDADLERDLFGPLSRDGAVFGPYGQTRLVRVDALIAGEAKPLDEVRAEIRSGLGANAAKAAFFEAIEAVEIGLSAGVTLEQLAREVRVPLITVLPVTAQGRTDMGVEIGAVAAFPEALEQASILGAGEFTDLFESANGGYVVMGVSTVLEPSTLTFAQVEAELLAQLNRERRADAALAFAGKLRARLETGESTLEAEAQGFGGYVAPALPFDRRSPPEGVDGTALTAAYGLTAPGFVAVPDRQGGVTAVAVGRIAIPEDPGGELLSQVRAALTEGLAEDLRAATLMDMQRVLKPDVNQSAFGALRAAALGTAG